MGNRQLLEATVNDYAGFFRALDVEKDLDPICRTSDELLSRLDEFEALLDTVKAETSGIMRTHLAAILDFNGDFEKLEQRIDKLGAFVEIINNNLTEMEQSVDIAEEELNVADYSLRGLLLKPLLAKTKEHNADIVQTVRTNLKYEEFQPVTIFRACDYFAETDIKTGDPTPC